MGWIWASKTRGAYMFAIVVILVWLGSKVLVFEEGLETNGGELNDDEDDWLISGLDDWVVVATTEEVVVKEGGFTTSEVCEETPRTAVVRSANSVDCWM